ncbi:MAG: hypothetical protein D3923_03300 [Candidatus Electrothrix sp. AR3]|nr:hypothetical protein [Candidatus Electrothrix sp. AR3]
MHLLKIVATILHLAAEVHPVAEQLEHGKGNKLPVFDTCCFFDLIEKKETAIMTYKNHNRRGGS